jgi:Zn-dependent protease
MFGRGIRLFRLWGIPVELNISWVLILVLVTWSFATGFIPESYPGAFSPVETWILAFLTAILLFASILAHEFSHSVVALRSGLPIRKITLFMFGGVAQMTREVDSPSVELKMAAAGPLFTLVLAVVLYGAGLALNSFTFLSALLKTVASINVGVFIFNVFPGFPLDGGRILRAVIWSRTGDVLRATYIASRIGIGFAFLLMGFGVFSALMSESMISGLWMVLIGVFLRNAAVQSYRNIAYREAIGRMNVIDIMDTDVITVGPDMDLSTLVDDYFLRYRRESFLVAQDGALMGAVHIDDVRRVKRSLRDSLEVKDVMDAGAAACAVSPGEPAARLFVLIFQSGCSLVPVIGPDGSIAGAVTRQDFSDSVSMMLSLKR